ncbi:MAG: DNA-processing protein DprA [Spirochaetaceae bacterium]|jgi:DNA processing protein|nr:DNA-processing protein DprA [Spirochaetaceae bacterium]
MDEAKTKLLAAISAMSFLKHKEKKLLQNSVSSVEELAALSLDGISVIVNRALGTTLWQPSRVLDEAAGVLRLMGAYGIGILPIGSEAYPAALGEIFDPPYLLFYRGFPEVLGLPCVSVVGTRHPTARTKEAAYGFAREAAAEGFTVVSGLAFGIDSEAHRGALSAQGGVTCAVLASGVDMITPPGNKALARAILARRGCILSEYCPGTDAAKWRFPERNRIISGLSAGTVVADGPENSGALITADFALEQGRDLFFHEAALSRPCGGTRNAHTYTAAGAPVVSSFKEYLEKKEAPPGLVKQEVQAALFEGRGC